MKTILLFVTALNLALAAISTLEWGYTNDGAEMKYQTSSKAVVFRWEGTAASNYRYAIGTGTVGPTRNDIVDWKQLTTTGPTGPVRTIAYVGAPGITYFPTESNIYVTICEGCDSSGVGGTALSSDPLFISESEFFACTSPGTAFTPKDAITGAINSPPRPSATFGFDLASHTFLFNVIAYYLHYEYTWVVDFSDFSADTSETGSTYGFAATSCENKGVTSWLAAGRTWQEVWNAAPNAKAGTPSTPDAAPYSLDSTNYPAWRVGSDSPWNISTYSGYGDGGCGTVQYQSSFTYSSLFGCKGPAPGHANAISAWTDTASGKLVFNGTLYVTAAAPLDPTDATKQFVSYHWQFPFQFLLGFYAQGLSTSNVQLFNFYIRKVWFTPGGGNEVVLNIDLVTDCYQPLARMDVNLPSTPTITTSLVSCSAPGCTFAFDVNGTAVADPVTFLGATVQEWHIYSTPQPPTIDFKGDYTINFHRLYSNVGTGDDVQAKFYLDIEASDTTDVNTANDTLLVEFFSDSAFAIPQAVAYGPSDIVYVRSRIDGLANTEYNSLNNDIDHVVLCASTSGAVLTSCSNVGATILTDGDIVSAGAASSATTYGTISIYNTLPGGTAQLRDAGVSFQAVGLIGQNLGPNSEFYVEVVSTVSAGTLSKRVSTMVRMPRDTKNSGIAGAGFRTDNELSVSSSSDGDCQLCIILPVVLGSLCCIAMVFVVAAIAYRKRPRKAIDLPELTEEEANQL